MMIWLDHAVGGGHSVGPWGAGIKGLPYLEP